MSIDEANEALKPEMPILQINGYTIHTAVEEIKRLHTKLTAAEQELAWRWQIGFQIYRKSGGILDFDLWKDRETKGYEKHKASGV